MFSRTTVLGFIQGLTSLGFGILTVLYKVLGFAVWGWVFGVPLAFQC